MNKQLEKMTVTELKGYKEELLNIIEICRKYLATCPNTFLGPLGARAEIRKCNKKIEIINRLLAK